MKDSDRKRIEEAANEYAKGTEDKIFAAYQKQDFYMGATYEHSQQQTVIADLTRQLEEEKGGYRMAIDMLAEERKRVKEKESQLANQRQYTEDHLLTIEGLRSQLAEAKEEMGVQSNALYSLGENLKAATQELDRWRSKYNAMANSAVRLQSELSSARELMGKMAKELDWALTKLEVGDGFYDLSEPKALLTSYNSLKQKG